MLEELLLLFSSVGRPSLAVLKENAEFEGDEVSRSALWYLLNGKGRPRLRTIEAFVRACSRIARQHRPPMDVPSELLSLERWRALYLAAGQKQHVVVPHQLPLAAPLVARQAELDQLDRLQHDSRLVLVTGTAGVGKTTLALSWARRVAEQFPDGTLYVNLRGFQQGSEPMRPEAALRAFLDSLAVPPSKVPTELAARAALFRSLLDGRRFLVVLDNAYDVVQVRPLLPASAGCLAVVTTRRDLAGLMAIEGARRVALDVLDGEGARQLLCDRLGDARVAAEPDAVDRIIAACAGLPLALAVVAARAALPPERQLAAVADELQTPLEALTLNDQAADVRAVLSWSYHALPTEAARLFRVLGVHPGPELDVAAAASLAGVSVADVNDQVAELVDAHLLTERGLDRFGLHDLLREYANDLGRRHGGHQPALERLVRHCLVRADAADQLLDPHRDDRVRLLIRVRPEPGLEEDSAHALAWFRRERVALVSIVDLAFQAGLDEHAWQLARALITFLDRDLHWTDWFTTATVALRAAERLAHQPAQGTAHRSLAHVAVQQGRLRDAAAHLEAALVLFAAVGDPISQAATHNSIGGVCEELGLYEDALGHARNAQRLFSAAGDELGEAHALNSVGWCMARLGRYEEALASCEQSCQRLHLLGDRFGEAVAWDSTGFIRHTSGAVADAVACFENALDLFRGVGERFYESVTLDHLGDCHPDLGQREAAEAAWRQSLAILRDLDHNMADVVAGKLS